MASEAQLTQWKFEAETALHRLVTGSAVEEIAGPNGIRTRFMVADVGKLQSYIAYLDQQIYQAQKGIRHRPIFFSPSL